MHRTLRLACTALLGLLALSGCGGEKGGDTEFKVGVILPMTGKNATFGEESWNGMQMALDELKATGFTCALTRRDDKSSKTDAGNQAKFLIDNERVHALLGSVQSSNTEQIALVAKEAGIPLITPASTNDTLTKNGGPLISRICFDDRFQGAVLANFAADQGWKKAVAVVDKAQVYSTGLSGNVKAVFTARGGSYREEFYVTEDTDFANTIQIVADEKPDVIFMCGYYDQGGLMIRQAKEKWAGIPLVGGDGFDSPKLGELVGETKAQIFLSSHFAADAPDPKIQKWAERYKARFGAMPGAMAGLGYDVLGVLADAAKRCKNPKDAAELAKAIAATSEYAGITGKISLTTPDRTPIKDAVIMKVDGVLKYHATVPARK